MMQLSPGPRPQIPHPSTAAPAPAGLVGALLRRTAEPTPLLTWYRGENRVELSGRTLGTWIAKTIHLMDGEGVAAGDRVGIGLLLTRPLHWVTLTWLMACWWAGAVPVAGAGTALQVSGPDPEDADPAVPLVQCSLTPMADPCDRPAPGAIDFSDALAMPDQMPSPASSAPTTPRLDGPTALREEDLRACAAVQRPLLLAGRPSPADLAATLAGCLAGAGSLILVEDPHGPLEQLAAQEHAMIAEG